MGLKQEICVQGFDFGNHIFIVNFHGTSVARSTSATVPRLLIDYVISYFHLLCDYSVLLIGCSVTCFVTTAYIYVRRLKQWRIHDFLDKGVSTAKRNPLIGHFFPINGINMKYIWQISLPSKSTN